MNNQTSNLLTFLAEASAPVQIIAFFITWAGCWLPLATLCAFAINWRPFQPLAPQKLLLLASLYLVAPLVLWGASRVVRTSFSEYGITWDTSIISSLWLGFGGGVLGLAVLFGLEIALGWVTWQADTRVATAVLPTLLLALWIGGTEELVFRGFLLTQLQQDYSLGVAAATSSVIFALLHLVWEQKETLPQLPGLWCMGMVLVLARSVAGGSLGLAWGLHSGWIWAIALLDSAQVTYTGKSAEWVTGLAGKPLAGAAGILCLLATGVILYLMHPN